MKTNIRTRARERAFNAAIGGRIISFTIEGVQMRGEVTRERSISRNLTRNLKDRVVSILEWRNVKRKIIIPSPFLF